MLQARSRIGSGGTITQHLGGGVPSCCTGNNGVGKGSTIIRQWKRGTIMLQWGRGAIIQYEQEVKIHTSTLATFKFSLL